MTQSCDPKDIALKAHFMGPLSENGSWLKGQVQAVVDRWVSWRKSSDSLHGRAISLEDQNNPEFLRHQLRVEAALMELQKRLESEVNKFSPRYMGHMVSDSSMSALLGHISVLLHNPNNVSQESSLVGVELEKEGIEFLLELIGWSRQTHTGHFTSGGTIANLEAAWRARDFFQAKNPNCKNPKLFLPKSVHYSWPKIARLLGFGEQTLHYINLDSTGRMCTQHLEFELNRCMEKGDFPWMLVSVAGTTELGIIDPICETNKILEKFNKQYNFSIWHHIDAAYGGMFLSCVEQFSELQDLKGMLQVDSITMDPHKLGYVPYSCGAFVCRKDKELELRALEAPYLDFETLDSRGAKTIEGSRAATGVGAFWMTAKTLGLNEEGYGRLLAKTIENRKKLSCYLNEVQNLYLLPHSPTNILGFVLAKKRESISEMNLRMKSFLSAHNPKNKNAKFVISSTRLKMDDYVDYLKPLNEKLSYIVDVPELLVARVVLMNPFVLSKESNVDYFKEFAKEFETCSLF